MGLVQLHKFVLNGGVAAANFIGEQLETIEIEIASQLLASCDNPINLNSLNYNEEEIRTTLLKLCNSTLEIKSSQSSLTINILSECVINDDEATLKLNPDYLRLITTEYNVWILTGASS